MVFRDTQREEYKNNPLEEVICQIRFPPILKIGTTIPAEFQDRIRKQFPLYEQPNALPVPDQVREILSQIGIENPFSSQTSHLHRFNTSDRTRSITLQSEFIAFSVTDYKRWQAFRHQLEFIEREFRCLYEPHFYSRIGLRYRDRIVRENLGLENHTWSDLLKDDITGFLGQEQHHKLIDQSITAVQMRLPGTDDAQLTLQYGMQPQSEQVSASFFIDADLFIEKRTELNDTFEILDQFNRIAGNIFRWAISSTLRDALGPEPI